MSEATEPTMELTAPEVSNYPRPMSSQSPQDDDSYELIQSLLELAHRIRSVGQQVAVKFELSNPAANALVQLSVGDRALSMRELAARLRLDPSRVTALADQLEDRGLIERRVDPSNRSIKLLTPTAAGLEARRVMMDAVMEHSPLARLRPADQVALAKLLRKAIDAAV